MHTQLTQRCDSLPSFCLKPRRGSSWSKVSPRLDKPYTCVMKKTVYLAVFGGPRSQVFNTLSQSLEVTCNIAATEGTAVAVEDSISSDMIHCQLCNPAIYDKKKPFKSCYYFAYEVAKRWEGLGWCASKRKLGILNSN